MSQGPEADRHAAAIAAGSLAITAISGALFVAATPTHRAAGRANAPIHPKHLAGLFSLLGDNLVRSNCSIPTDTKGFAGAVKTALGIVAPAGIVKSRVPKRNTSQYECCKNFVLPYTDADWEGVKTALDALTHHLADGRTPAGVVLVLRRWAEWWEKHCVALDWREFELFPLGLVGGAAHQQPLQASAPGPPPSSAASTAKASTSAAAGASGAAGRGNAAETHPPARRGLALGAPGGPPGVGELAPTTSDYDSSQLLAAKIIMMICMFPLNIHVQKAVKAAQAAHEFAKRYSSNTPESRRGSVDNERLYILWCSDATYAAGKKGWAKTILQNAKVDYERWVAPQIPLQAMFGSTEE
jgi:hypothetical protein